MSTSNGTPSASKISVANLNTILMFVALGVLGWIGLSTQATAVKLAAIETKMDSVVEESQDHETRIRSLERKGVSDEL